MNYQEIDGSTIMMIWQGGSNDIIVVPQHHLGVFTLLDKLGIKSTPMKGSIITFTTPYPGNYAVSYSAQTVYVTTTAWSSHSIDLKVPKEPKPPKKFGKPDKDMRRQWRDISKREHSRNTGRSIGRR